MNWIEIGIAGILGSGLLVIWGLYQHALKREREAYVAVLEELAQERRDRAIERKEFLLEITGLHSRLLTTSEESAATQTSALVSATGVIRDTNSNLAKLIEKYEAPD